MESGPSVSLSPGHVTLKASSASDDYRPPQLSAGMCSFFEDTVTGHMRIWIYQSAFMFRCACNIPHPNRTLRSSPNSTRERRCFSIFGIWQKAEQGLLSFFMDHNFGRSNRMPQILLSMRHNRLHVGKESWSPLPNSMGEVLSETGTSPPRVTSTKPASTLDYRRLYRDGMARPTFPDLLRLQV